MAFELLSSETIHKGRVFSVRRDEVRLPDGGTVKLDIVEHAGAVTLLPLDEAGNLLFVRQYRHAAGAELLELPAGMLEAGEAPEACAQREIREETGMAAGELRKVGEFFLAPGYSTEYMHVYLAQKLKPDPLAGDEDEFLSVEHYPLPEAYAMLQRGEFRDSKTIAALCLARSYING